MAPKLKEKHIELPPIQANVVNLAAQVLSHSVAAGISTLVTLKYLPEQAVKTATFVDHFDALFNIFNPASHSNVLNRWAIHSNNQAPIMPFLRRA